MLPCDLFPSFETVMSSPSITSVLSSSSCFLTKSMIIFLLGSSHGSLRSQVESFSPQDIHLVQCWLDSENLGSPLSVSHFQGVLDSRWRHFGESHFLPTEMFLPILILRVRATPHLKFVEILLMHCLLWIFPHTSLVVNFSLLLFLQWTDVYIWPE